MAGRKAPIPIDHLFPLAFDAARPRAGVAEYLQDPSLRQIVDFFQHKGLADLKREDRTEAWYADWVAYQAGHGIYASLLSPRAYSNRGGHLDLRRLVRCLEVLTYLSPAHAYNLHVTFLGLSPILMSANEPLKREAVAALEAGGLFAFGVSERGHGSDLLANEFAVRSDGAGGWVADGSKYYIGNANAAAVVSILGRRIAGAAAVRSTRAPFVFFVLRPAAAPGYRDVRRIHTLGVRTAFVGSFEVAGHPVADGDIMSEGREAWDAMFGTVDFGKFFLGFGAVGIAEHAFAEAHAHLADRVLYGKPVMALAHIRRTVALAYARLAGMKLYAYRALDYLQSSGPADRRYLLFNSVQKAKVSTEGVKVLHLLSECVGAKGFESDTYFETALRDAPMIPGLEGSTHINFARATQFLDAYFAESAGGSSAVPPGGSEENPYWLGTRDRHAKAVTFPHHRTAYRPLRRIANVRLFVSQVTAFRRLFAGSEAPAPQLTTDVARMTAVGRCFATIAYGQLVAEGCVAAGADESLVSVIFHALVEDLTGEAQQLAALFPSGGAERDLLRRCVRVPRTSSEDLEAVFGSLAGRYAG